ncbi:FecR domain-containing protein [Paraflavitalea speifideaquila]|uniref:FecR domain-containing protein n=1 Tax=Paraflavitalea speifideaquila TaxID=3076558 RepID=UPI0028ED74BE|nr:FecR domain-containing protein [Paraflavitalea speifideiaquila]
MADFKNYTAEDYLSDPSFVNYLLRNNEADASLWQNRRDAGLVQEQEINRAITLFFALRDQYKPVNINKEEERAKLKQLISRAEADNGDRVKVISAVSGKRSRLRYAWAAAAAVIILLAGTWYFRQTVRQTTPLKDFVAFATTQKNIRQVALPDGSTVILNGNSSISITPGFNHTRREVLLNGTAFFQVAKMPINHLPSSAVR